ncbi:hypothetical protein O0L34_g13565 [Tuta absoluta]|nr:hypothetical protein O0L34_g13565 [Tuta absoluta]
MECTQRLDFEPSQSQAETWRSCPDQIGFLGILGTKYPVVRGPNKIGRDPQTCNIVLNLNSISRQHAVINVLNNRDFMLMDLDSANKTRLNNKSLQPYLPVALSNGDTVQFGEAFGVFRLLVEDADLPSTQAIDLPATQVLDVPDTPLQNKHADRFRQAVIPESPEVSDKDDSFIVPSQPKPGNRFKNPCNNFIKPSSKTISIQPIGSNKIDNVFWSSSKKSNSFNLDDSSSSANVSNGDLQEIDQQNESNDSLYTAETQLPPATSIHSQETQLPAPNVLANKENIYNAETQLPTETDLNVTKSKDDISNAETQLPNHMSPANKIDDNIHEANTELPLDDAGSNNDNIFEAETQLPPNKFNSSNKESKSIHEMDTQVPFPNNSTDSLYTAETQLPPVNSSPSIYSQATQLPKLNDFEIRDSPKSIHEVNTQLPLEEQKVSIKRDDNIFNAETQLPTIEKESDPKESNYIESKSTHVDYEKQSVLSEEEEDIFNAETPPFEDFQTTSEDKSKDRLERSDDIINFNEIDAPASVDSEVAETQNILDEFNAFQPVAPSPAVQLQEESEDIPLSQSDTITDDDFQITLEEKSIKVKPAKRDARTKSNSSTDCEDIDFLPTQKIPVSATNEEDVTDCEEDVMDGKKADKFEEPNKEANFEELATQIVPAAVPLHERVNFEDLATQIIPESNDDGNIEKPNTVSVQKPVNEPEFEDMLTQVIPEKSCDKDNIDDLPTQVIPEIASNTSSSNLMQCSEEVVANPFKMPLPTPLKAKKKEILQPSDNKSTKSLVMKPIADNKDDEKYYAATQEIYDDLCSQKDTTDCVDAENHNNNHIKNKSIRSPVDKSVEKDHKLGTKFQQFDGEIEISVKKFAKCTSSESSDGEEKICKFVKSLTSKQINEVIGTDVAPVKRVPSDPSDAEVTPKKVRPFRFMDTLLPDSQEIKTSVTLSTTAIATDSSSESEVEKESQELTPIVHRKKKRAKANVKKDLTAKFDVQALPTRIITRTRKPTAKVQENDTTTNKRGRNILKPKFLNDTEQEDEVDTEIISENITRLRTKNDKKNHKDTTTHDVPIEEIKAESNHRSNEENLDIAKRNCVANSRNKFKNSSKNTIVDLTVLDEVEKPTTRNRKDRSKNNKEETAASSKETEVNHDITTDSKKHDQPRKLGRSKKKDVQDKITNYTVNTDDSRISRSVNKVDDSINTNDSKNQTTKSTRQSNNDTNRTEKSAPVEQETKRKRGRPKKEDKKTDSKIKTDEKDANDSKHAKRRKKDDEKDKEPKKYKKDNTKKTRKTIEQDVEPKETRRSTRQKTTKEQNDSQTSIRNHEQSTVYNVSSESSDSPKRKRLHDDSDAPSSKRSRAMPTIAVSSDTSSGTSTLNSNSSSLRSTPSCAVKTQKVLFTAFPCEEVKVKLQKLGAVIVSEVSACTVVLTLQLRRTFKLLCAVGLGRPIVGPQWVQACVDTSTIVDPWQYLLKDVASESRFKFSLRRSLGGARGYLRGYHVSATPKVLPSAPEMKLIVECSGGTWQAMDVPGPPDKWLVVSCLADKHLHPALKARGATLVTSELILSGVLKQELDIKAHLLQ